MGYADTLLADGERIVLHKRQHWLALLLEQRTPIGLVVLGILLGLAREFFRDSLRGTLYDLVGVATLILIAVGVLWFLVRLWGWLNQDYLVTTRRVMKVEGIFNKRSADSSLEKINDAVLTTGWLGRLLGYGDLEILTAAETEVDVFTMLADARDFKKEMLNQKFALESDMARPTISSPPLRTAELSREGATDLLARLAELRDKGAITAEEYEAKKRDLLERI
jgi:uncharacterized membrane protein YdbT with pleckstrin-like domain